MPKICYVPRKFQPDALDMISKANVIVEQYAAQGYDLTLRQLYYQFVSRGYIANRMSEYKRLGSVINDARLAGLIDWNRIEDRTRNLEKLASWQDPAELIGVLSRAYKIDLWENQEYRPEVWIEKDALTGVIEGICQRLRVPYLSCRGYTSQSEMWRGAMRMQEHMQAGQRPYIIHLGDHDPSGKDMSRDICDRLALFMGGVRFNRIALNMDQIQQYNPPPNPAKITDSRAIGYIREFGSESWELDALEPRVITDLISEEVLSLRDEAKWAEKVKEEQRGKDLLEQTSDRWDEVEELLS
jgi:hypothetical protein